MFTVNGLSSGMAFEAGIRLPVSQHCATPKFQQPFFRRAIAVPTRHFA
jgi:hypothetical protein